MSIKSIIYFLTCLFLLSSVTSPVRACPPPDCGDCKEWDPVQEKCVWKEGAECEDSLDCKTCYYCMPTCTCELPYGSECGEDDPCPGECHTCVGSEVCLCENDDSKCDPDECCDNGTCVDKCDPDGGDMCTWTNPPVYDPLCEYATPEMPFCINPDKTCNWQPTSGPGKNATCADCAPGCTKSEHCVVLMPILCDEGLSPLPPFYMCRCIKEPDMYDPVPRGTRDVCE